MTKRKCYGASIYWWQVFSLLFVFADLMSFLKQIRNETARTVSCNNNIGRDSSLELQKELDGVSDNTLINDVWWWLASWQVYPAFWVVSPDHGRPPQPGCTSNSKSRYWPDFFYPFWVMFLDNRMQISLLCCCFIF